MKVINNW